MSGDPRVSVIMSASGEAELTADGSDDSRHGFRARTAVRARTAAGEG